jgi:flagellar protein FliO/FliZ
MAMTLGTTAPAWADGAASPAEAPAAPGPEATPLTPRPSRPLTLAPRSEGTPIGWKLLAGVGVAVAAGLWIRKRRGSKAQPAGARIEIVGRTAVGMRSELLVVDVEGARLLVGVSPSALQTLAVLDPAETRVGAPTGDDQQARERPATSALLRRSFIEEEPLDLAERVRSLVAARRADTTKAPRTPEVSVPRSRKRASGERLKAAQVAGQAKGLLLALQEPSERRASGDER